MRYSPWTYSGINLYPSSNRERVFVDVLPYSDASISDLSVSKVPTVFHEKISGFREVPSSLTSQQLAWTKCLLTFSPGSSRYLFWHGETFLCQKLSSKVRFLTYLPSFNLPRFNWSAWPPPDGGYGAMKGCEFNQLRKEWLLSRSLADTSTICFRCW